MGDVQKAFLTIEVDPRDRDFLAVLWVEDMRDNNLSIVVYRFSCIIIGVNASLFLLNGTKNRTPLKERTERQEYKDKSRNTLTQQVQVD